MFSQLSQAARDIFLLATAPLFSYELSDFGGSTKSVMLGMMVRFILAIGITLAICVAEVEFSGDFHSLSYDHTRVKIGVTIWIHGRAVWAVVLLQ